MPTLLAGIGTKAKPPQKAGTLKLISRMAQKMPESVGCALVNLAMPVAELTAVVLAEAGVVGAVSLKAASGLAAASGPRRIGR